MAKRKMSDPIFTGVDPDSQDKSYDELAAEQGMHVPETPAPAVNGTPSLAPPRRRAKRNTNAVDLPAVYGIYIERGPGELGALVCTCPTVGQARKRCATLQDFPQYQGHTLLVVRLKTVERFRP